MAMAFMGVALTVLQRLLTCNMPVWGWSGVYIRNRKVFLIRSLVLRLPDLFNVAREKIGEPGDEAT